MTDVIDPRILRRYDIEQKLGQGAYGIVWKAKHRKSGAVVALKKCFEAFRCNVDAQRTFREVEYLKKLAGHDNIVTIQRVWTGQHRDEKDLYITFDYMDSDLSRVIKAKILEDIHIRFVIYQLLKALKYIHSARLLHRDIKPSNILIDASCRIKLCDFGLCRSIGESNESMEMTDYVATRWYRSPEILMGSKKYTVGLDLWSVGCILGEMFRTRPLLPGASTMNQLEKIFEVTGNPSAKEIQSWQSLFAVQMIDNVKARQRVKLDQICHNIPKSAKHFIKSMFKLDPAKRGTAETALKHEYVEDFHDEESEPVYPHGPIKIGVDDNIQLSADQYRELLFIDTKEESRQIRNGMKLKGDGRRAERDQDVPSRTTAA